MKKIKFNLSGDSKPYIESLTDFSDSIFTNQYKQCISLVDSYIQGLSLVNDSREDYYTNIENNNNIFAFDGERGSGKTSCMLSVAKMLMEKVPSSFTEYPQVARHRFTTTSMIDPSFFDKDHNIISLFIARLYNSFLEWERQPEHKNVSNRDRAELLTAFIKVQQNLSNMFGLQNSKDGLENLVNMAASVDIRTNLKLLVDQYLKYIGEPDSFFILLIDDIDIDDSHAYEMAEFLRKYFIQPNIIVFVSVKIEQLTDIIRRKLKTEYKVEENNNETNNIDLTISDRSERYLAKLIPAHQRIYMPTPNEFLDYELIIENPEIWKYNLTAGIQIKQVIPELIFQKTRFLFYNSEHFTSYIVPKNLRNIRQLLKLLIQLPDYSNDDESKVNSYNKEIFCQYFYNDWCDINITTEYKRYIKKILKLSRIDELNYEVVQTLNTITNGSLMNRYENSEPERILDNQNIPYNISFGDVLAIIRATERSKFGEEIKKFLFFLKSYYSIVLYKAYDTITSSREDCLLKERAQTYQNVLIEKKDYPITHNNYEAILGGCLYNDVLDDILPIKINKQSLSNRRLKKSALINLLVYCSENWSESRKKHLVDLAEFFMLCIQYDESKDRMVASRTSFYRRTPSLYYEKFDRDSEFFNFSLSAFLFNLSRFEEAIHRFEVYPEASAFFKKLKNSREFQNTLYDQLLMYTYSYRSKSWKTPQEKWLSFCCFRNTEIIENLLDYIQLHKYKTTDNEVKIFEEFFETLSKYSIQSYDRYQDPQTGEKTKSYDINFRFFEVFANIFKSQNTKFKEFFNDVFNNVYISDKSTDSLITSTNARNSQATKPDQDPIGASAAQR